MKTYIEKIWQIYDKYNMVNILQIYEKYVYVKYIYIYMSNILQIYATCMTNI